MSKPILAITMGDPAGIGPEIAVKALEHAQLYKECIPVVIGDYEPIREAATFCSSSLKIHCIKEPQEALGSHGTIDFIDLGLLAPRSWEYKKVSAATGDASYRYIERAISLALNKSVHGVVTGPINKEAINLAGHHYSGHTEIFAALTGW